MLLPVRNGIHKGERDAASYKKIELDEESHLKSFSISPEEQHPQRKHCDAQNRHILYLFESFESLSYSAFECVGVPSAALSKQSVSYSSGELCSTEF
jgi:hypothetical protein